MEESAPFAILASFSSCVEVDALHSLLQVCPQGENQVEIVLASLFLILYNAEDDAEMVPDRAPDRGYLDLGSWNLDPSLSTLDPGSQVLDAESRILGPGFRTPDPGSRPTMCNPEFWIHVWDPGYWDPESWIQDPGASRTRAGAR